MLKKAGCWETFCLSALLPIVNLLEEKCLLTEIDFLYAVLTWKWYNAPCVWKQWHFVLVGLTWFPSPWIQFCSLINEDNPSCRSCKRLRFISCCLWENVNSSGHELHGSNELDLNSAPPERWKAAGRICNSVSKHAADVSFFNWFNRNKIGFYQEPIGSCFYSYHGC